MASGLELNFLLRQGNTHPDEKVTVDGTRIHGLYFYIKWKRNILRG